MSDWLAEQLRRIRAMRRERDERERNDIVDWGDAA